MLLLNNSGKSTAVSFFARFLFLPIKRFFVHLSFWKTSQIDGWRLKWLNQISMFLFFWETQERGVMGAQPGLPAARTRCFITSLLLDHKVRAAPVLPEIFFLTSDLAALFGPSPCFWVVINSTLKPNTSLLPWRKEACLGAVVAEGRSGLVPPQG